MVVEVVSMGDSHGCRSSAHLVDELQVHIK